jgi:hypothetical protein
MHLQQLQGVLLLPPFPVCLVLHPGCGGRMDVFKL